MSADLEDWLQSVEEELIRAVVAAGAQLARRRKGPASALRHTDCQPFLERTLHLHVPGVTTQVRPYRRPAPSTAHQKRMTAVRTALRKDADAEGRGNRGGGGDA